MKWEERQAALLATIVRFASNQSGQGWTEYGLIVALVAVTSVMAFAPLGPLIYFGISALFLGSWVFDAQIAVLVFIICLYGYWARHRYDNLYHVRLSI